tara:strand:- start:40 stop:327 length:288 start_codon:yes stop_codon:yes gene_type:complete
MSFFTWKDSGLTSDCSSLDAMASRFEETANLMKKLSEKGFKLKKTLNNQLIIHSDQKVFDQWGFISEELPFKQLCLIPEEESLLNRKNSSVSMDK